MSIWHPVESIPRDGTPVLLWLDDVEAPPSYRVTVGTWVADHLTGARYWHVFAKGEGSAAYFDEHVWGWMPLPKPS